MTKEVKPGDTVFEDEESKKLREQMEEEARKRSELIAQMMQNFTQKFIPANHAEGCDLKSTWELQEMFESVMPISSTTLSITLMELGFKTTLIGNEFKWMLRPTSAF